MRFHRGAAAVSPLVYLRGRCGLSVTPRSGRSRATLDISRRRAGTRRSGSRRHLQPPTKATLRLNPKLSALAGPTLGNSGIAIHPGGGAAHQGASPLVVYRRHVGPFHDLRLREASDVNERGAGKLAKRDRWSLSSASARPPCPSSWSSHKATRKRRTASGPRRYRCSSFGMTRNASDTGTCSSRGTATPGAGGRPGGAPDERRERRCSRGDRRIGPAVLVKWLPRGNAFGGHDRWPYERPRRQNSGAPDCPGLTQERLAREAECSLAYVQVLDHGYRPDPADYVRRFAGWFHYLA